MCGINGFLGEDPVRIGNMNAATAHRGPDGTRSFVEGGVSLGHNRLAIIDLDTRSNQPMESASGRFVIVYNGELYNFRELKAELTDYPYKTEGDTEVILAAFEKWGSDCFARFSGIFALAIWDRKEKTLTLARDRSGVKPLYYNYEKGRFAFSSELAGLLTQVPAKLSREALDLYLSLMYVPGPHSLVEGIKKLELGTYATVRHDGLKISTYLKDGRNTIRGVSGSEIRSTIGEAIKAQLVSDRPVGVFLSGGFDSSIVLHHVMEATGKAETFTTGFELPAGAHDEDAKFNADLELARKTAAHYGTTHHEQFISLTTVRDSLENVLLAVDEPIANSANIPSYHLSKFARERVVVALDGSGGDELFGGYDWYRANRAARYYKLLPKALQHALAVRPILRKMAKEDADYYLAFMGQPEDTLRTMLPHCDPNSTAHTYLTDRYFKNGQKREFLQQMMDIHRTLWLVDESLTRTDKLGMAHGLEVRVPLLDDSVIDLASHIPATKKATVSTTKIPLKDAYRGILPEHIYGQPKRGWFPPGAKWLRDPGIERVVRSILSPEYNAGTAGLFDWHVVNGMLDDHIAKRGYHFKLLWALVTFQVWARRHNVTAD